MDPRHCYIVPTHAGGYSVASDARMIEYVAERASGYATIAEALAGAVVWATEYLFGAELVFDVDETAAHDRKPYRDVLAFALRRPCEPANALVDPPKRCPGFVGGLHVWRRRHPRGYADSRGIDECEACGALRALPGAADIAPAPRGGRG